MSARTSFFIAYSLITATLVSETVTAVCAQSEMPKAAPVSVPMHLMPAPAPAPASAPAGAVNPSGFGEIPAPDAAAALTINPARAQATAAPVQSQAATPGAVQSQAATPGAPQPQAATPGAPQPQAATPGAPQSEAATLSSPQSQANAVATNTAPSQNNELASQFPTNEVASALERVSLQGWQPISVPSTDLDPDRIAMLKEFGCKNSYSRIFQRGQRRIIAVVYVFNSSQGAYGAYSLLRRGSSTVIPKGDASSEDDQSISIWKDRYFITVSGTSEDDEESKGAVTTIATQLNAASSARGQLPQLISRLPNLDRVRGTEKVVMGPISARKFFPAPSLISLSFANSSGAGLADYALQAPFRERMKLMVVNYSSASAAQSAYDKYVTAIEETHPNMAQDDSGPRAIFKMANSYLMCELRSQRILLISGARKRTTPMVLSRQVI